jgi:hypothetical protein
LSSGTGQTRIALRAGRDGTGPRDSAERIRAKNLIPNNESARILLGSNRTLASTAILGRACLMLLALGQHCLRSFVEKISFVVVADVISERGSGGRIVCVSDD